MVRYHKLFEVKFYHQYYEAFTSKDFIIHPTHSTKSHLKSYGVIFKQTAEGLVLLYPEDKRRLLERLKEEISFEFGIRLTNKYFETFTQVSPGSPTNKYLFSNRDQKIIEPKLEDGSKNQIKLHTDSFVTKKNVCLCCYSNILLKEFLSFDEVVVRQDDDLIYEGNLEEWHTAGSLFGSNYGVYEITSGDSVVDLYYLTDSLLKEFGLVELVVGFGDHNLSNIEGAEFEVWFASRQVQWNYFFVSKPDKLYDSVALFLGKEKLSFSSPELVTLINGQQSLKVVSEQLFPLKYRYNDQNLFAELKQESQSNESDLGSRKVNLATPEISRIKGKRENGTEIYFSDMYIYL